MSWAAYKQDKGFLKEGRVLFETHRMLAQPDQIQACQVGSAKQPTFFGQKRRRSRNSSPLQKHAGEYAEGNAGKTALRRHPPSEDTARGCLCYREKFLADRIGVYRKNYL